MPLMETRILHTKFWIDEYIGGLTPAERLLFIYFLTNDRVNIIHCYELPERKIFFDTGIKKDQLDRAVKKFDDTGRIGYRYGYVYLYNASRYERYEGEKNEIAKSRLIERLPEKVREWFDTPINRGIDTPLIGSINHKSEIINHNKGGVGGIKLADQELKDQLYLSFPELSKNEIDEQIDTMIDWHKSTGKMKKDYLAFARNWIRKYKGERHKDKSYLEPIIVKPKK